MKSSWIFRCCVGLWCFACWGQWPGTFAAEQRFTVGLMSGQRIEGREIYDWYDPKTQPRLDNNKLFNPEDLPRWIQDNTLGLPPRLTAYVEFSGGDRFPGRVIRAVSGTTSPYHRLPPHVVIDPDVAVDIPVGGLSTSDGVPVATRWLQRVVWEARDDVRFRPGTLFYRDGRHVEFRSLRWGGTSVKLLLAQETRDVPFNQIAELHLPRIDPWDTYFEQLATLAPKGEGTILRMETVDGLRLTTSLERLRPTIRGNSQPEFWYHVTQPAWALEPLWVRHRQVRLRTFFRPHEIPLSSLEPVRAVQRTTFGGTWLAQADRNAQGAALRSGDNTYAWGWGVHAYSQLEFELPPSAKSFQTQIGLDKAAGDGGCARARIHLGQADNTPLFESPHLIGSSTQVDTGRLYLPAPTPPGLARTLVLVVDPAHQNRPSGTDPFEIRDICNWLQPVLELDLPLLKAEIVKRFDRTIPAWQDWSLLGPEPPSVALQNSWELSQTQIPYCRFEALPTRGWYGLSRQMTLLPEHKFLALAVSKWARDVTPSSVQVRVNGQTVGDFDVPVRPSHMEPDPLLIPLGQFRGQQVRIELLHLAQGPTSSIEWRAISLVSSDPSFKLLFDEDPRFPQLLDQGKGIAHVTEDDKFTGEKSLKLVAGDKANPRINGWHFPIRGYPGVGEYRFLRFAWRKKGGQHIGLFFASDGQWRKPELQDTHVNFALGYQRGTPSRKYVPDIAMSGKLTSEWEVHTRDLFADFGDFNFTGLSLVAPDGEAACFDSIYLARRLSDFDKLSIPAQTPLPDPLASLPPEDKDLVTRVVTRPAEFFPIVTQIAPELAVVETYRPVMQLREFRGRKNIVRTLPEQPNRPTTLRGAWKLPADHPSQLRLPVSHHANKGNWQLTVKVNNDKVHTATINDKSVTRDGWSEIVVDLAPHQGQQIVIELQQHIVTGTSPNGVLEAAYWAPLAIERKP